MNIYFSPVRPPFLLPPFFLAASWNSRADFFGGSRFWDLSLEWNFFLHVFEQRFGTHESPFSPESWRASCTFWSRDFRFTRVHFRLKAGALQCCGINASVLFVVSLFFGDTEKQINSKIELMVYFLPIHHVDRESVHAENKKTKMAVVSDNKLFKNVINLKSNDSL